MSLEIETGTGNANADSYVSRQEFLDYCLAQYAQVVEDEALTDTSLRRAASYMDSLIWKGTKTNGRNQALAWPRSGVVCDGNTIPEDEIPREVKAAQFEFARAELAAPGVLSPQGSVLDAIRNRARVDVIEVGFDTSRVLPDLDNLQVVVTAGMRKVECFLVNGGRKVRMTDTVAI